MFRTIAIAGIGLIVATAPAMADPIEGMWQTKSGSNARIAPCGGSYCITLTTGKFAGKRIGELAKAGAGYSGKITDPKNDKTYSGKGAIEGDALTLSGCVFGGLICRDETWHRH